jgi:hypothetical protein
MSVNNLRVTWVGRDIELTVSELALRHTFSVGAGSGGANILLQAGVGDTAETGCNRAVGVRAGTLHQKDITTDLSLEGSLDSDSICDSEKSDEDGASELHFERLKD